MHWKQSAAYDLQQLRKPNVRSDHGSEKNVPLDFMRTHRAPWPNRNVNKGDKLERDNCNPSISVIP